MKIILDAMGGDLAPKATVLGAVQAVKELGAQVILVGRGDLILSELERIGYSTLPSGIEILDAPDVVDMHDAPETVVKQRKDSSMIVGLRALADGQGDAFISAGSTGALLTAATLIVKRIRGIRRAALSPTIPCQGGQFVLIDCGANAECTPEFLLQFAFMGSFYAKKFLDIRKPRVALLNNGVEDSKGTDLQKQTYPLLQQADRDGHIHFIGNIEAREVMTGGCDVLVADGFSGNVFLKCVEGTAKFFSGELKNIFTSSIGSKIGALLCLKGVNGLKKKMDYRETGGTLFLGISKPVIKAHGSSDERAVFCAIRQAMQAVASGVTNEIAANIDAMRAVKE